MTYGNEESVYCDIHDLEHPKKEKCYYCELWKRKGFKTSKVFDIND